MALTRGSFHGCDFDRMILLFSMLDGDKEISCAVSTAAMDNLESPTRTRLDQREAQFMRLRDQIEQGAIRKYLAIKPDSAPRDIILRSVDFPSRASPGLAARSG